MWAQGEVGEAILPLQNAVRAMASLDALHALAVVSASPGWVTPSCCIDFYLYLLLWRRGGLHHVTGVNLVLMELLACPFPAFTDMAA